MRENEVIENKMLEINKKVWIWVRTWKEPSVMTGSKDLSWWRSRCKGTSSAYFKEKENSSVLAHRGQKHGGDWAGVWPCWFLHTPAGFLFSGYSWFRCFFYIHSLCGGHVVQLCASRSGFASRVSRAVLASLVYNLIVTSLWKGHVPCSHI